MVLDYSVPADTDSVIIVWAKSLLADMASLDQYTYKKHFSKLVQTLLETSKDAMPSQQCRLRIAGILPEAYFNKMGEYPSNYDLEGLANYVMLDYLKSVNKKKSDENSFHSEKQAQRRASREYLVDTNDSLIDFLYCKYTLGLDSLAKKNNVEVDD